MLLKVFYIFNESDVKTFLLCFRKILTTVLKVLVNNPFKENFLENEKNVINILTTFFISHKSDIKTFLKWIINEYLKNSR